MSAADDFTGPVAVLRARAQTVVGERAKMAGCLICLIEAVGYAGARSALDAEWARAVANDPRRAEDEGFVG